MRRKKRTLLGVERLEDRWNPAFLSTFDPVSSTWTLTQIANNGHVQVVVDGNITTNEYSAVTSITVNTPGSGYTSTPAVNIAPPPAVPGAATATATATMEIGTITLGAGGTGYSVGNVLSIGPPGTGGTATVTAIGAGGTVTAISLGARGSGYTVGAHATTGAGTGATINVTSLRVLSVTVVNGGSGYLTPPAVSFVGGGGTGATATASVDPATATLGVAGNNLKINLLANTLNDLLVTLDAPLAGNLTIQANNGARNILFDGGDNTIGGKLALTAGTGNQTIDLAVGTDLSVGSTATITTGAGNDTLGASGANINVGTNAIFDMSTGNDTFDPANNVTIGGSFALKGANIVDVGGTVDVGTSLTVTTNFEFLFSSYLTSGGTVTGGNFVYYGSNRADTVGLGTGTDVIGGSVTVYLGTNILGGDSQLDVSGATINGSVTVTAGATTGVGGNNYISDSATTIDGNIIIRFGNGTNDAQISGTIGGQFNTPHIVQYVGGSGVDTVTVELVAESDQTINLIVNLGAGADTMTLEAGNPLAKLLIDFGLGIDTFNNNFGAFTFPAYLLRLP